MLIETVSIHSAQTSICRWPTYQEFTLPVSPTALERREPTYKQPLRSCELCASCLAYFSFRKLPYLSI
eukprot:3844500-Pleurochrysis_carterae.AAC.2